MVNRKEVRSAEDYVEVCRANDSKIILLAIDALSWRLMTPLLDQGRLPNLKSLMQRGTYGPLKTICPALSPELWNSISTGKLPKKHGITGFMAKDPKTGKLVPFTSNMRRCHTIWEILGDYDKEVGVVGWWNSWPAEPVNGSMVSGILGYKIKDLEEVKGTDQFVELTRKSKLTASSFRQQAYPEPLFDEIREFIRPPDRFDDSHDFIKRTWENIDGMGQLEKQSLELITSVYNIDRTYKDIAKYIYTKSRPDFLTFYVAGVDVIGHKYWIYMEPEVFSRPPSDEKIKQYGSFIHEYYEYVDQIVGEFADLAGDDTILGVVSDHGMSADDSLFRRTGINSARHFDEDGIFILSGPSVKQDHVVRNGVSVLDITPTLLRLMGMPIGADMDGRPMEEALTSEFRSNNPVKYVASYDTGRKYTDAPVESPVDDEIKARLKSLGYID
ncbi:MAG: alkaline phosphatase family protein [Deltaproteobacteria bacterium]|nr:alkaline phosphatase family protein [Deltaproteobacteria bacterium]